MRRHRIGYAAAALAAITLMMAGLAIALYLADDSGQNGATAGVLGAVVEPEGVLPTPPPSATPSPRSALTLTPTQTATAPPAAVGPPLPTQAPPVSPATEPPPQPPPPPSPPAPPPPADWPDYEFAARVLSLVNAERAARGLAPLEVHPALAASAQAYARLLVTTGAFGHEGPDGSTVASRIYGAGLPGPAYLGESLWWAVGSLGPEQVVSAWLASESHRQVILDPVFRLAGIGCHFRLAERLHGRCVLDLAG